jgi:hypothetical protein
MSSKIQELQDRIFKKEVEYTIIDTYDYLMCAYGYIPYEEFKKMDAFLVSELIKRIKNRDEKNRKPIKRRR